MLGKLKRYGGRMVTALLDDLDRRTAELKESIALQTRQRLVESKVSGASGRVALVGCGTQGRYVVRAVRSHLPEWSVTHLHDLDDGAMQDLGALAPSAERHATLEPFLAAAAAADLLVIATTAPSHEALTSRAVAAGVRRILLEKPVATSLAGADRIVADVERTDTLLYVNHSRRWAPSFQGVGRLLGTGVIGEVRAIRFTWGPGAFAMIGTHLFDLARMWTGEDIVAVRAERDEEVLPSHRGSRFRDHSGRVEAATRGGIRVSVDLSSDLVHRHRHALLVGTKGRLAIDEGNRRLTLEAGSGRGWRMDFPFDIDLTAAATLDALLSGEPPACSAADGRAALECAIACDLSADRGSTLIELPLRGEDRQMVFPYA